MAAGATYTPIATQTISGSSVASVTFSSIPSTYTDLILVAQLKTASTAGDLVMQFNSDTGTNYSRTVLYGTGSAAGSSRESSVAQITIDNYGTPSSTEAAMDIIQIMNYANTTTYKTVLARANKAGSGVDATVGLWRSTSAINSILLKVITNTVNIAVDSTFTLYGIVAA